MPDDPLVLLALYFWPFVLSAVISALMPHGHRWLAIAGIAVAVIGVGIAMTLSNEPDFFASDRELLTYAAIWWGGLWLAGVAVGSEVRPKQTRTRVRR